MSALPSRSPRRGMWAALFVLALLPGGTANPLKVSPYDSIKSLTVDGRASRFFMQPEGSVINLQTLPARGAAPKSSEDTHAGGTKILPIDVGIAKKVGEIVIEGRGLDTTIRCDNYQTEHDCLIDVECGWCYGREKSHCVEGSFAGPCNATVDCPVYVTYQQEGMGSHDCGTNTRPCIDEPDESDLFKEPEAAPDPFAPKEEEPTGPVKTPEEIEAEKEVERKKVEQEKLVSALNSVDFDSTEAAKKLHLLQHRPPAHKAQKSVEALAHSMQNMQLNAPPPKILPIKGMPSPCGFPGTTQMMCEVWIKENCGGDNPANDAACDLALTRGV